MRGQEQSGMLLVFRLALPQYGYSDKSHLGREGVEDKQVKSASLATEESILKSFVVVIVVVIITDLSWQICCYSKIFCCPWQQKKSLFQNLCNILTAGKKKNYLHKLAGGNFKKYNRYLKINALKSALYLVVSRWLDPLITWAVLS